MRNLAVALGALVVVLLIGFLVFGRSSDNDDITSRPETKEASGEVKMEQTNQPFTVLKPEEIKGKMAKLSTDKGDIAFELYEDAPFASSNFISLASRNFYDGLTFHRREEGFVIQGGDPSGDGTGGPGYKFKNDPVTRDYKRGIVAMANAGPDTNGSQFFIMLGDTPLPKLYSIFGMVTSGMDVVDKIQVGDKIQKVTIE
ncbi:MAG: peptidylprolyl isomerase [Candidatus Curtissbacteria bacterium]|nr:peptidylprolyl isomerase [Candidatus Curtissbacteria bacterium]